MRTQGLVIGVDLGGTKMHAAAVDENGTLLHAEREKTLPEEGADAVIGRISDICRRILHALSTPVDQLRAVCVGVPGGVDDTAGMVDKAPNLKWEKVPLAHLLSSSLGGVRVFLDNDVRVAVTGEHAYGCGRGTRTMVGIFVGTGIGGGAVIDGRLHMGARGVAGELGHMIIKPKGPRCPCGKRGCAEALASRTSMERDVRALIDRGEKSRVLRMMKKDGRPRITSSVIAKALEKNDPVMTKVMERAQHHIGILVSNVVNLLDPEVVVIGGGIAERLGESFVAPIRETAYERLLVQRDRDRVRIVATELKEHAAPMGAAFIARQRLAQSPPAPVKVQTASA
jgi:glucokinase